VPRICRPATTGIGLSSYNESMKVATSRIEVGVRELKNNLSRYLDRVQQGEEVIVTDRGRPVARLSALGHSADRLGELIATGVVRPPKSTQRARPARRIEPKGSVSDLVADQRR
jgi:prevent-host-death family protein